MQFRPEQLSATPPIGSPNKVILNPPGDLNTDTKSLNGEARDKFMLSYMYIVDAIVGTFIRRLPRTVNKKDLIQEGEVGLLDSAKRYDPKTGVPFSAFARFRIRGHILDYLREADPLARSTRRHMREIPKILQGNEKRKIEGLKPLTEEEVAEELGISIDEYKRCLDLMEKTSIESSLDDPNNKEATLDTIRDERILPDELIHKKKKNEEIVAAAEAYFSSLESGRASRLRDVYEKFYLQDIPISEIAKAYGISVNSINQYLIKVRKGIKEALGAKGINAKDINW